MTGQSCRIQRQGTMFIFSAPSGGGKSSLIKGLLKELDDACETRRRNGRQGLLFY